MVRSLRILTAFAILSLASLLLFVKPIPQPQAYHLFADQRLLLATIPNTFNVTSNVTFVFAGLFGLFAVHGGRFLNRLERLDATVFFAGTILTAVGSSIYHLHPEDVTLVYDRGGMIVAFVAFLAMIVHERFDAAPWLLPALIVVGIGTIAWWRRFDDLRPYGWVQFFPIVAICIILTLEKPRYTAELPALTAVACAYVLAKVFEMYDGSIYAATSHVVSGHTLKHLVAACAPGVVACWVRIRSVIDGN